MAASVSESLWSSSLKFFQQWNITKKPFMIKQLWRSFKFFLFILILSETNRRFRMQTLKSLLTSCFFFFYSYKIFNFVNSPNLLAFVNQSTIHIIFFFQNIRIQGGHRFWNSLNSVELFLILELYLKKVTLSGLFWKCSWI